MAQSNEDQAAREEKIAKEMRAAQAKRDKDDADKAAAAQTPKTDE